MESSQSASGFPPPPPQAMLFPPPPPSTSNHHQYTNNYPLKNIPQPHPHDVLCGRGGGTNAHIGNSHWRMLVSTNKELYVTLPKRQKMLLSKSIVNAVRSQHPPGRFLQKDPQTELWYDVGDQRAQEKTSQALREGAPDIRSKLKPNGKAATATATATAKATLSATTSSVRRRKSGSTDGEDETISPKSAATSVASSVSPPLPSRSMPPSLATPTTATDGSRSGGTEEPLSMFSAAPAPGGIAPPSPPPLPMMPGMILNQIGQPVPSVVSQVSSSSASSQQQPPPVSSSSSSAPPLSYPSGGLPAPLLVPPPPVLVGVAVMPSLPQPISPQGPVPEKNRRKKNSTTSPAVGAATTSITTSSSATSSQTSISTTSTTLTPTTGYHATTTEMTSALDADNDGGGSGVVVAAAASPPPDPIPSANDENNNGDNVIVMVDHNDDNDQPKTTKEEVVARVPPEKEEDVHDDVVAVEYVEPPSGLDPEAQFSFGSIALTDMEQAKLMNGFSIGSAMSYIHQTDQQQHHQQKNETSSEPLAQRSERSTKREDSSHVAFHNDHYHYPQDRTHHPETPPALGTYQQQDLYPSKQQYPQYQQQQYDSSTPSQHYPLHYHQQQQPPPQHLYGHPSKRYPQAEPQYHQNHQPNESQTSYFQQQQAESQFHQQSTQVFDDQPQRSPSQHYHHSGPQYALPMQHGAGPSYHNHDSNYCSYTKSDLCDRGSTAASASDCRGPFSESMRRTTPAKEMMPPPPPSGVPASVQYPPHQQQEQQQQRKQYQEHHSFHQHHHHHQMPYPPSHVTPIDGGLEPAGLSFGSVMSIGTADPMKLEPAGLSFGSTMSYSVAKGGPGSGGGTGGASGSCVPDAVDGGLEAIGTSFGSLSLNTNDPKLLDTFREEQPSSHSQYQPTYHQQQQLQEQLQQQQQETAAVQAAPTFLRAQKSKGSLLECSDTDSDDEEKSAQISYQKSVEWEKLKAVLAQQPSQPQPPFGSIRVVGGPTTRDTAFGAAMPPPATHRQATLNIPSTTFDRDFSQISAISAGGDIGGGIDDNYTPYSLGGDYFYQPQVMPPVLKTESDSSGACNEMPPPPPAMKKHDSGEW